ncbi:iron-sulfur cluster assembly accessory protein [bacterium]|nr:iron-sulfur cluster assembly accessory protein [bacterium]
MKQICTLTSAANAQISTVCEENNSYAVSLNIKGGGCAGFEYDWGIMNEEEIKPGDEVIACDKGNFVISAESIMFLIGTEIDYVKTIIGSNFEIKNPNADSSCGCGVSVNFKTLYK